jgi:hypothetical protein
MLKYPKRKSIGRPNRKKTTKSLKKIGMFLSPLQTKKDLKQPILETPLIKSETTIPSNPNGKFYLVENGILFRVCRLNFKTKRDLVIVVSTY